MAVNLADKAGCGNVLICVTSDKYPETQKVLRAIKKRFPGAKDYYADKTLGILSLECRYTMEDSIYPALQKINQEAEEFRSAGGKIVAYAIFLKDRYTEQIIFSGDPLYDSFTFGTIRDTNLDEVLEREKEFWGKYERCLVKYKIVDISDSRVAEKIHSMMQPSMRKPGDSVHIRRNDMQRLSSPSDFFSEGKKSLESLRVGFVNTIRSLRESLPDDERKDFLAALNESKEFSFYSCGCKLLGAYIFDGRGNVFTLESMKADVFLPYYMQFTMLFFLPKADIKDMLTNVAGVFVVDNGERFMVTDKGTSTDDSSFERIITDFLAC